MVSLSKETIRKNVIGQLTKINEKESEKVEKRIHENIFSTDLWKNAKSIGITVSQGTEWDTFGIIEQAWKENKKASVPKSIHKSRELHFYQLDSFDQLEKGYYDLQEPVPEMTRRTEAKDIDLLVVPGLAFNEEGYRIGFGGGFYDRFLQKYPNETVSLVHTTQFVDTIPVEEHDVPVNTIVTEKGIVDCKENRE